MCGIYGVYNFNKTEKVRAELLTGMGKAIEHRGPDDEGVWADTFIALGQRRLSIIDLSTGHQPMANEDSAIWMAYNGEVYNYLELKKTFLDGKHQFLTTSDTEVIIHLYEEFDLDCVNKLNGMFAFAIWDKKKQRMLIVRDRVGIKPLYYMVCNNTLIFASEIKAILQYIGTKPVVNLKAVSEYLSFGYTLGQETMFKEIYRLPPGYMLICDKNGPIVKQYWDLKFNIENNHSESYYVEKFRSLLMESVKLQLRSDVPLGVFLSGGIDSSTVVGMVSSLYDKEVKTFSAVFNNIAGFSEAAYSRLISRTFKTKHFEVDVSPKDFRDFIPQFIWHLEEPTTDPSGIPLYYVSKLASQQVKVMLSGEGADEILAGYTVYKYMKLMDIYRRIPSLLRNRFISPVLKSILRSKKVERFFSSAELPLEKRYFGLRFHDFEVIEGLISNNFKNEIDIPRCLESFTEIYKSVKKQETINQLLYVDTKVWLSEDILIKSDRMSMATSIELRVPFLDKEVIEFAASIPPRFKMKWLIGKYILKQAVKDLIPNQVITRKKTGFPVPIAALLRQELREYVQDVLLDSKAAGRGYFNNDKVQTLFKDHLSEKADNHKILWMLFILELWHRKFIDLE